jgi:hypothetical protein
MAISSLVPVSSMLEEDMQNLFHKADDLKVTTTFTINAMKKSTV